jgi:hypothetical protein
LVGQHHLIERGFIPDSCILLHKRLVSSVPTTVYYSISLKAFTQRDHSKVDNMEEPIAPEIDASTATSVEGNSISTNKHGNDEPTPALRKSALQDNIERKGKNAYYFAHSHKANGPAWDGKVEPKLLSRMSVSSISESDNVDATISKPTETKSSFDYSKSNITTYAFLDDGAKVKLYIDLENVGEQCTDSDVTLEYTDRTLSFTLHNYKNSKLLALGTLQTNNRDNDPSEGTDIDPAISSTLSKTNLPPQILRFGRLCEDICNATYRIKKDKVILTLTKVDATKVWATINDQGVSTDHHEVV